MNCDLGGHIRAEGWHNWNNADNEKTARYLEYNNRGAGAKPKERVGWSRQLSKKEAQQITLDNVFSIGSKWDPTAK
jgi:pectinesterase